MASAAERLIYANDPHLTLLEFETRIVPGLCSFTITDFCSLRYCCSVKVRIAFVSVLTVYLNEIGNSHRDKLSLQAFEGDF